MKKKLYTAVSIILTVLLLFIQTLSVSALNFNGTASSGGDGSSTTASTGGYAISSMLTVNSNRAVGYRFTIIDASGDARKNSKDVFRYSSATSFGQDYAHFHKFNSKLPKTYYRYNYTSGSYSTSATTTDVCHDTNMNLTLPEDTTALKAWCTTSNMGTVLSYLWNITISTLESYGWAVLIEPIFPLKIEGTYHSLTVTEIGVYGTAKFGSSSNGGSSSNSNSWGFISNYTNRYMPNSLRLTSAQAGIPAASYITSRISFGSIVTEGYGAAIVYGEYLSIRPEITATTYYQESYDGFYVYIQTLRTQTLVAEVWTTSGGTDDLKVYGVPYEINMIDSTRYDWCFYVPKSSHNGELGYYNIKLYATSLGGTTATKTVGYQPPVVTTAIAENTESQGFYVYANTESATSLGINVWTELNGQDDMIWSYCTQETNTVNGVTYSWVCFVPFSQHNLETGKYLINFYVSNNYSTELYARQITYKPNRTAQLRIDSCDAYDGKLYSYAYRYGTSYGPKFENFILDDWYPTVSSKIWFTMFFYADIGNELVRETIWLNNDQSNSIIREGWYRSLEYCEFAFGDGTIQYSDQYLLISAKIDLIDESGNVTQAGDVFSFYFPVQPTSYGDNVSVLSVTGDYVGCTSDYSPVYSGQRIYPQYEFKSEQDWYDYFDYYGCLRYSKGYDFINAAREHLNAEYDYIGLNQGSNYYLPHFGESLLSPYTVPKDTDDYNELSFLMSVYWTKTDELIFLISYNMPIIKADVAIFDIALVDDEGYILDHNNLTPGQKVTLRYYYANDSECTVYVNGYNYDESQIGGIFAIPPYSTITVEGATFTVPDDSEFTLWGGVYYEGAGIYNTEYELDGTNNEYRITCKTVSALKLEPIMPNAAYRENTEVVTSFWVVNPSATDFTTQNGGVSVNFKVYNLSGNLIADTTATDRVVPANDKNIVYFKWKVPNGITSSVIIQAYIVGMDGETVEYEWQTTPYSVYSTPDTKYEAKKPDGFSVPQTPMDFSAASSWWEYFYENGTFVKKHFGVETHGSDYIKLLVDDPYSNKDATAIKSGYPISLEFSYLLKTTDGYNKPDISSYTEPQYIIAKFPEYKYITGDNKCKTLIKSYGWVFRDSGYLPVHFIPIYYPDRDYYVSFTISDIWTPSGCIYAEELSQKLTINGSAYEDWYIHR